jgi:hypothetical protein
MQFINHITLDVHRVLINACCSSEHSKRRAAWAACALGCESSGLLLPALPAAAAFDLR